MTAASINDPLGYDARVSDDLARGGAPATGAELAADAILHRMMADTLPLIGAPNDEAEYGEDVTQWIGQNITPSGAQLKAARLAVVFAREDTIDPGSIRVVVDPTPTHDGLYDFSITVNARTKGQDAQPIALVVGVNSVTVAILSQGK